MKGDLLWVYEGLTSYLGVVLAARSGLWNAEQAREHLALLSSTLDHRAGRTWRSLENTSRAAQILYFSPSEWASYRRGTDFYGESVLIWLEADVTIRRLSRGQHSLDDFCRSFLGGPEVTPTVRSYTFDDLVTAMNAVAAHDWAKFFRDRLTSTDAHAPLGGIRDGGWKLEYNEEPNQMIAASEAARGTGDYTSSIGLTVKGDGTVQDVIPGMAAYAGGMAPYTKIMGVNGRAFSIEEMNRVLKESKAGTDSIKLVVSNAGQVADHQLVYHEGLSNPHLVRSDVPDDYLGDILKPRTAQ
jgi:predicted metalloprotease with PDZ domain